MIFAEHKGFWDVVSEQGPAIVAMLLAAALILFFGGYWGMQIFKWVFVRYVDPGLSHLMAMKVSLESVDQSSKEIVKSNHQIQEALAVEARERPSDWHNKLKDAKCAFGTVMTREEVATLLAKMRTDNVAGLANNG